MEQRDISLEDHLQQLVRALDHELGEYAARDEEARAAIAALRSPTWADPVNRLLGEVNHRSGLLLRYRLRDRPASSLRREGHEVGIAAHQYSATLAMRRDQEGQHDEGWRDASLKTVLPQVKECHGISISVEAVRVSAQGIRIHFQLQSDVFFGDGARSIEEAMTLVPIVTGVSMADRLGTLYTLQPAHGGTTARNPHHTLPTVSTFKSSSAISFTPTPPMDASALLLTITSVLITVQPAYLMTATPARLIDGPWEFAFSLAG